jgi:dTDP-4-dehydrorhamnose 3,5-epimerase-like enzyme
MNSKITDCLLMDSQCIRDSRGNLNIVESTKHCPFDMKRIFYVTAVPFGQMRGGHAHKELHQLVIAVTGHFSVTIKDGVDTSIIDLQSGQSMLYIPPLIWAEEKEFSEDAVMLVIASDEYDEEDYIRSYKEFLNFRLVNTNER